MICDRAFFEEEFPRPHTQDVLHAVTQDGRTGDEIVRAAGRPADEFVFLTLGYLIVWGFVECVGGYDPKTSVREQRFRLTALGLAAAVTRKDAHATQKGTTMLSEEPGWYGAFTRAQAPGAYPNGQRIVKVRSEPGDSQPNGTPGTVLGSVAREGVIAYFIEWDTARREAVLVLASKTEPFGADDGTQNTR